MKRIERFGYEGKSLGIFGQVWVIIGMGLFESVLVRLASLGK